MYLTPTGYSPFELLYGWTVWRPLDILKECWEASFTSSESIASQRLTKQEKLEKISCSERVDLYSQDTATAEPMVGPEHLISGISVGDEIPVLLLTSTCKLLAQWNGQYLVLRKVGPVTYAVVVKPTQAAAYALSATTFSTLCSRDVVLLATSTHTQYEGALYFQSSAFHAYHYVLTPRFYNCALLEITIHGHSKPVAMR